MQAMLVDDESIALDALISILQGFGSIEIIGTYTSPKKFLEEVCGKSPDVVFLDIEMPGLNGFAVAEELLQMDANIMIVFVTAYNEYAIKAFEINAMDYVLKPISRERLEATIHRILNTTRKLPKNTKTIQDLGFKALKQGIRKVPVWKSERIFLVNPADISYCFAQEGEVSIIMKQDCVYKSKHPLSVWEEKLKFYKFFRCHRSFLVNVEKIEEVIPEVNSTYSLKMKNVKEEVPVSRSYLKAFKKLIDL